MLQFSILCILENRLMEQELHPFILPDLSVFWPLIYFSLLVILSAAVVVSVIYLVRKAAAFMRAAVIGAELWRYSRRHSGRDFLYHTASVLYRHTSTSGELHSQFPGDQWLSSISVHGTDFTTYPYRLLLDAFLKPADALPEPDERDRRLILSASFKAIISNK